MKKMMMRLMMAGIAVAAVFVSGMSGAQELIGTGRYVASGVEESSVYPPELSYMSKKMYYLKTGKIINNRINYEKQKSFWGKGVPSKVKFPSHLAMWEEARRTQGRGL